MPDKKDLKEVTDPSILAQLNQDSGPKEVTDPSILAQLNGNPALANTQSTTPPTPPIPPTPHLTLAQDILNNQHNLPDSYAQNINNVPFTHPGNIVNQITDPAGDPAATGGYTQTRLSQMERDRQQAIAKYQSENAEDRVGNPQGYQQGLDAINKQYGSQKSDLSDAASHTIDLQLTAKANRDKHYDPIKIGIEKQVALGDKNASQAEADYNSGRPLPAVAKVMYQSIGLSALNNAKQTADASGQQAVSEEIGQHSDNPQERLEKDNPEYFTAQRAHEIGNYIAKNENSAVYGTLFSHELTQDEINAAGKKLGYSKEQLKDITPENVPSSASIYGQVAQGVTNAAAPIYEGGMRALGALGIANQEAVNQRFTPGWEKTNAASTIFTGQTPDYQDNLAISQPRSLLAAMAKGVGQLGAFLATAEVGGGALKGAGVGLQTADKMSQFATAALLSYNEAYQKSVQMFGDSPKDESKRQAYSILNGIMGGSVMMIDPQASIARDIIGETEAGKSFIKTIKDGGIESLTKPELQSKVGQMIQESTKHLGLQTSIPAIQTAAGNIADMMFDPNGDHHVLDNVGEAALSGGVGMFIPSIMSGIMHPRNQTAMNKSLMYEVGTNPYEYKKEIGTQVASGKMSQADADVANSAIDKLQYIIGNQVPSESLESKPLTQGQKQDYAWNLLQDSELQKKLKAAEVTQDKAQIDQVKSKIGELTNERNKLLDKAGEVEPLNKPSGPAQEKPNQETTDERSVANQAEPETQTPAQKKDTETLGNTKEDVSLNSSDNSQEKTTGHENENSTLSNEQDNGRQATIKREGQSTDGEKENDDQGRNDGQNRPLNPSDKESAPAASQETAGEPVRKKRKFVEEPDESPHEPPKEDISIIQHPELDAFKHGTLEGMNELDAKDIIKNTPNDQKVGGPDSESFNEFVARIKDGWENLKGTAKDDALFVANSSVKKVIDAAEEHGWGYIDKLKEAYNSDIQPKPGEFAHHETADGEIYTTRHPESVADKNKVDDPEDTPLTKKGEEQAKENIAGNLKKEGIEPTEIHTSGLDRNIKAAEIVKQELQKPEQDASTQSKEQQQEITEQSGESEHAGTQPARNEEAPASAESGDSIQRSKKEEKITPENNQGESPERSVAENPSSEKEESAPKEKPEEEIHTKRIKEIDLQLQREHASQHQQGEKRAQAEKAKDIEAANKANDLWYKKQDKIDKLNAEREELSRKQEEISRDEQIKKTYKLYSDKVRAFGDKSTKGSSGMLGIFPGVSPHLTKEFTHIIADAIDQLGNLHAAIIRGIERFKEKYPDEKVTERDVEAIKEDLPFHQKSINKEPILSIDNEESAKDIIADLSDKKISYHDAVKEVMSGGLSDTTARKILQYIDWHTTDRAERNDNTLDQKGWLNKHTISHSGEIRDYLSLKTDEDIYGAQGVKTKNTDYQETKIIEDLQRSGNDIFNQAQKKYAENGEPIERWGAKFLGDINKLNMNGEDAGAKKVLALTSLGNELQGQSRELQGVIDKTTTPLLKDKLEDKKAKTDELMAKVQDSQTEVLHDASITLNAARVRRLFRNEHLFEMYEQKILSENDLKAKAKFEKAENETKIPDEVVNEGVTAAAKEQKLALNDEKKASQERSKKEKVQKEKPVAPEQPKKKNVITRLKERIKKTTEGDTRGRLSNDELAKGRVDENSLLQQIKEELKNKKPC